MSVMQLELNRSVLYALIAVLSIGLAVVIYQQYYERPQSGIDIKIDEHGIKLKNN